MKIRFKKLNEGAQMPTYGTEFSAGADLYSTSKVIILPGLTEKISTGLSIEIPKGYVGLLFPRSGLSFKTMLRQPNCVGVIDSDYRGEVMGGFTNTGKTLTVIEKGDRFGQLVIVPCLKCEWEETDALNESNRGIGGFGSTGK